MLRNKNGVTLALLIVAIIVMLIIFGVTVETGTELITNSEKNRLMTNLYLIKARATSLLEDYLFDESLESLEKLGDTADSTQVSSFGFEEDSSCEYIYCIWNSAKLSEEGIDTDNIATTESFIIQYNLTKDSVDVASTKGFVNENGDTFYVLSALEEN